MPAQIPDLWGGNIDVDVVPPLVILKTQAEAIARRTKGVLTGNVTTVFGGEESKGQTIHQLLINAPSLGYTEHLLSVTHGEDRVYPSEVRMPVAISWLPGKERPVSITNISITNIMEAVNDPASPRYTIACVSQDALISALRVAFTSPPVTATLNSLLARVNEQRLAKTPPVTPAGT